MDIRTIKDKSSGMPLYAAEAIDMYVSMVAAMRSQALMDSKLARSHSSRPHSAQHSKSIKFKESW